MLELKSLRTAYSEELVRLGELHNDIVVLDADLAESTKTCLFKKKFPDRHIDCGIAEANMVGIAAGLETLNYVPFINSFAMFIVGRAYEQIRNTICYSHLNVKICAAHTGVSPGEDGGTHQCFEDISLMKTIPNLAILSPSDYIEAKECVKAAYEHVGPIYIRLSKLDVPVFNLNSDYKFKFGKGIKLNDGKDITIIATGNMVFQALETIKLLQKYNISADLINIHTIKPIDKNIILESAQKTRKVITIEEHSILGGLGDIVASLLSSELPTPVYKIGINDIFCESGKPKELLKKYGLTADEICKTIISKFKN